MKGFRKSILILLILLTAGTVHAQNRPLWQLDGVVRNEEGDPLKFVHIVSLDLQLASLTDETGMFAITTTPGDTVIFSCMGYKDKLFRVPESAGKEWITRDITLKADTIQIEEVVVLPWATYEEFKQAVLDYRPHDPKVIAAERNIALIRDQINHQVSLYPAPGVSYREMMSRHLEDLITYNQMPVNNLLNPISWAKFFEAIKEGKLRLFKKEE